MKLFIGCVVITGLYLSALFVNRLTRNINDHEEIIDFEDK